MRLNTIILIVMLAGALAAAGWLLLANPKISGTPIAVLRSRHPCGSACSSRALGIVGARHRPPGAFGRAAHRAAPSAVSQAPWPSSCSSRRPRLPAALETDVPDPLVRRPRPSLSRPQRPLLAYPDASLAFDFYLDHPIAEVPARQTIAGRLQSPAAGALLLRDAHWEDVRRTTHPSWCPVDRVNLGYRSFVLLGACR